MNMNKKTIVHMREQIKPDPQVVDALMDKLEVIQQEKRRKREKRYNTYKRAAMAVAAAVFAFMIVMSMPLGNTLAEEIKKWLIPTKILEMIEGDPEVTVLNPMAQEEEEENLADYVIYVNEEYFTTEQKEDVQTIWGIKDPEAKMTISQKEDCNFQEYLEEIRGEKGIEEYEEAEPLNIQAEYQGIQYREGFAWDDIITRIYCIDNGKGGCFIVEYCNTIEADEGFGSRFRSMLNTFEIIEIQGEVKIKTQNEKK